MAVSLRLTGQVSYFNLRLRLGPFEA